MKTEKQTKKNYQDYIGKSFYIKEHKPFKVVGKTPSRFKIQKYVMIRELIHSTPTDWTHTKTLKLPLELCENVIETWIDPSKKPPKSRYTKSKTMHLFSFRVVYDLSKEQLEKISYETHFHND